MPTSAPRPTERARVQRLARAAFWVGLGLGAAACTSAATRVALQGDLQSLKAAIADAERQGSLDSAPVQDLAEAVLTRELSSLRGPSEQFPPVAPCVERMRSVLEDVAAGSPEFGAPAAMALIDGGFEPKGPGAREEANVVVLARQAVGASAGSRRRAFMLHGDAEVRRAALLAARDSADVADTDSLLEAARLDPDPEARSNAVRALGQVGGARAVLGLLDLWAVASTEQRRDIVLAWSMPPSFGAGGERELTHAVEMTSGEPAVVAALILSHKAAGPPGLGTSALLRFITGTQQRERLLALDAAPWQNPELRAAITAARSHDDPATRIISLSRLIEHGAIDAEGILELRKLSTASSARVALAARATLARAGDESVKPALRADLEGARGDERTLAALALMALEDWAGAARALADDSPVVRRAVACQMLAARAEPRRVEALRSPVLGSQAPALVSLLSPAPAS